MNAAEAFVDFSGQLIECNEQFALMCGLSEKSAYKWNLTDLAKFDNPTELLQSLYVLSILDSNQHWKVPLGKIGEDFRHLEHEIYVRNSNKEIRGERVLIATIKETDYSESKRSRCSSFCDSTKSSVVFNSRSDSMSSRSSRSSDSYNDNAVLCREPMTPRKLDLNVYNVLIVEDSVICLKMMTRMVTRLGHIVTCATDGLEALNMLKTHDFDIVFMDINMPNLNGLDASHQFRKMEAENRNSATARGDRQYKQPLKLIAISGDFSPTIVYQVMNAGFDGFLPKPLEEGTLVDLLQTVQKRK